MRVNDTDNTKRTKNDEFLVVICSIFQIIVFIYSEFSSAPEDCSGVPRLTKLVDVFNLHYPLIKSLGVRLFGY